MTHTQGSWVLGFADERVAFVNAGHVVVCKCDGGGDEGERLANPRANAMLIAATPDLLRIARALVDSAINDADGCPLCGEHVSAHASGCLVTLAEAAIANRRAGKWNNSRT